MPLYFDRLYQIKKNSFTTSFCCCLTFSDNITLKNCTTELWKIKQLPTKSNTVIFCYYVSGLVKICTITIKSCIFNIWWKFHQYKYCTKVTKIVPIVMDFKISKDKSGGLIRTLFELPSDLGLANDLPICCWYFCTCGTLSLADELPTCLPIYSCSRSTRSND